LVYQIGQFFDRGGTDEEPETEGSFLLIFCERKKSHKTAKKETSNLDLHSTGKILGFNLSIFFTAGRERLKELIDIAE